MRGVSSQAFLPPSYPNKISRITANGPDLGRGWMRHTEHRTRAGGQLHVSKVFVDIRKRMAVISKNLLIPEII